MRTNRVMAAVGLLFTLLIRPAQAQTPATLVYDSNTSSDFATTHTAVTAGSTLTGGWVDVQGGIWSTAGGSLTGVPDSVGGQSFTRDFLARPAGENQRDSRIVVDTLINTASFSAALRTQTTSKYSYIVSVSNGLIGVYKTTGNNTFTQVIATVNITASGTDIYEIDFSAVGASPTTLTAVLKDVTTSTTVATLTGTDSETNLQVAGAAAVDIFNGTSAAISRIRTYNNIVSATVSLTKPAAYQVAQRAGTTGSLAIAGSITGTGTHSIEASFNGGSYVTIATGITSTFSGTLSGQAQGQGTLTVREVDATGVLATVANVGVGDVFAVAGQSNAVGQGTSNNAYKGVALAAGMFGYGYTWASLTDPTGATAGGTDAVFDNSAGAIGSVWPLVATALMAQTKIPCAFVLCARNGAGLCSNNGNLQWTPLPTSHTDRTSLYGATVYRAQQAGGVKAVLYWGGETDGLNGISTATFAAAAATMTAAFYSDLGVKTMFCKLNQCSAFSLTNLGFINAGIAQEWASDPDALIGPDLSDLTSDDTYHLKTDAKIAVAASRWYSAIYQAFYGNASGRPGRRTQ